MQVFLSLIDCCITMVCSVFTILLVDASLADRNLYKSYIHSDSAISYRLLEANSFEAGLQLCRVEAIDAVLGSAEMPNVIEFLAAVKTECIHHPPAVILVASDGNAKFAVQAMKAGADDYLVKQQVTPELLQLTLQEAIANAQNCWQQRYYEERWQLALQANQDGVWDHDLLTNQAVVSDLFLEILGCESEALQDFSQFLEYVHPDDRETMHYHWQQYLQRKTDRYRCEYRVRYRDGSYKWVLVRGQAVWDRDGNPIRAVGSLTDITQIKQTEKARIHSEQRLRESEARLQIGVQVAGVALAKFDYASNTVHLTPEAAILYGLSGDELIVSRSWIHNTFHPDERDLLETMIQQVLDPAGLGWFARNHRVVWPNGEVRWLSVRKQVFFDRTQNPPKPDYAILAAVDITAQKGSELTLQSQLAQIEAIYASAPVGLCFLDRDWRFVQLNERLAEINGLSVAEHLGKTIYELLPDLATVQAPIFEQVIETGVPVLDVEVQGFTPAQPGVERHWLVNYYPLIAADDHILGINIVVQEITDRKRAELERNRLFAEAEAARAEAEDANRSKDEFVAIVAHELRSPLNSIAGWAKLLQTHQLDESAQAKALNTIYCNTQVQVQIVEDLLDISRMTRGNLHLAFVPVNLNATIEAAVDLVLPQAQAKHIQLIMQLIPAQVLGDSNRLQQIVVNLLINAIKFTPEQGRVEIRLQSDATQLQLSVRDTGKGIAPELLPHIFDRFKQGQQNITSRDGLGLGLAIVKHLVELHQGSIAVESAGIGQGATFKVQLPLLGQASSVKASESKTVAKSSLTGCRILVVDDEPDMLTLTEFILQKAGAQVETATTLREAVTKLSIFKPNLLISDISMSEGGGYELLQQIKQYPEGQIPAIALTAYTSTTHAEQSLKAGFQQHLTKPVEPDFLIAAIVKLMEQQSGGCLI
jgi:PAS domain S-box-containing protein